jgi:hypothetical protein
MLAGALALAVTTTGGALTLDQAAHASAGVTIRPDPGTVGFHLAVAHQLPAHAALPVMHTVRAGETLAGLAMTYCHGHANDWTGFYHDNRKVIGSNPNLIYPGQKLDLARCTDPPELLHLGSGYHAPRHRQAAQRAVRHAGGKTWGVTYGYPNKCGDGDHDGWDVPCTALRQPPRTGRVIRHTTRRFFSASRTAGHYSYGGLEQLWIAAGGPSWAASAAAAVAECESGGNVYAHNPSGATGLFQILGAVRPGNLYDPMVNAENAVAKFEASGNTWSQWVCKP